MDGGTVTGPSRECDEESHAFRGPVAYRADAAAIAQTVYDLIDAARHSIVLQMYLFSGNGETGVLGERAGAFPYAHTVARWLVEKRRRMPEIAIVVLLDTQTLDDPRWTRRKSGPLARDLLAEAGIPVLHANLFGTTFGRRRSALPLARLHDRRFAQLAPEAFGRAQQRWQSWHNVEDHRKNLVIDAGRWAAVTSHNFLDVSFDWHENLFLLGPPAARVLWGQARRAIRFALEIPQRLSNDDHALVAALAAVPATNSQPEIEPRAPVQTALASFGDPDARAPAEDVEGDVLNGPAVRTALLRALEGCGPGDRVCAATAFFADVPLLDAFVAAAARGARVQILVDDCAGVPLDAWLSWYVQTFANFRVVDRARPAFESRESNFELRAHPSRGRAMMHLKTAAFLGREPLLIGGQANYTTNSFTGAWIETGLALRGRAMAEAFVRQFDALWEDSRPPARPALPLLLACRAVLWLVSLLVRF